MIDERSSAQQWLEHFLAAHGGAAGTVHRKVDDVLEIVGAVNIPPRVREVTARIPRGKGMAGLAWERNEAVTTCNLQAPSADVRPGAAAVDARAAAALPVRDEAGAIRAVVGIAFADERTLEPSTIDALTRDAQSVP
jgi:hypothetical protein